MSLLSFLAKGGAAIPPSGGTASGAMRRVAAQADYLSSDVRATVPQVRQREKSMTGRADAERRLTYTPPPGGTRLEEGGSNWYAADAQPYRGSASSVSNLSTGRPMIAKGVAGISAGQNSFDLGVGVPPPRITMPKYPTPRTLAQKVPAAGGASVPLGMPEASGFGGGPLAFGRIDKPEIYGPSARLKSKSIPASKTPASGTSMNYLAGAGLTAMGAAVGGTASYATGGNFSDGAVYGAMAGGGVMGLSHLSRSLGGAAGAASAGWTGSAVGALKGFENPANRAYAMGAGAALGGFAFGGRKNSARGFNKDRGNRIGR